MAQIPDPPMTANPRNLDPSLGARKLSVDLPFEAFHLLVLLGVTLLGAALRLYQLGEWSLWVDEGHTYRDLMTSDQTFQDSLVTKYPLAYLLMRGFAQIAPSLGEGWLRLPFAFFGILSVPTLALIGRPLVGRAAALIAALLLAVSPWHIYWSQNCRAYALVLFLALLACGAYWRGLERRSLLWLLLAIGLIFLAGLAHASAYLLLGACLFHGILLHRLTRAEAKRPFERFFPLLLLFVLAVLTPLLVKHLLPLLEFFQRAKPEFSLGHLASTTAYFLRMSLVIAALGGALWLFARGERSAAFLAAWVVVPVLALAVAAASARVKVTAQYAFYVLPAVVLLSAAMIVALHDRLGGTGPRGRLLSWIPLLILLFDLLGYDFLYFTRQHGDRPRWREAAQYVADQPGDNKLVLTTNAPSLRYYFLTDMVGNPVRGSKGIRVRGLEEWDRRKDPATGTFIPGDQHIRETIAQCQAEQTTLFVVVTEPELFEKDRDGRMRDFVRSELPQVRWYPNWTGPKDMCVLVYRAR